MRLNYLSKKGLIFEGQVGRNAGNVPYMGWGISIYRATQGANTIQVKINGKLDHTYTVTELTGATYDLTDAINQVKKLYASGQVVVGQLTWYQPLMAIRQVKRTCLNKQ